MKAIVFAALSLIATTAAAAEITPAHRASAVEVVSAEAITLTGPWAETQVKVTATFGNPCFVPSAEELIVMTQYSDSYGNLVLTLGNISDRVCALIYSPVTVTINLGTYTRPNDGAFDKVTVNGVETIPVAQ